LALRGRKILHYEQLSDLCSSDATEISNEGGWELAGHVACMADKENVLSENFMDT
jgi:hypothetical protein